jgi:hypothetical protein
MLLKTLRVFGKSLQYGIPILLLVASVTFQGIDEKHRTQFAFYEAWSLRFDLLVLTVVYFLGLWLLHSEAVRDLVKRPNRLLLNRHGGLIVGNVVGLCVCLFIVGSLLYNGSNYLRARKHFWVDLLRQSYTEDTIGRINGRVSQGRVGDAYELAKGSLQILKGTAQEGSITNQARALGVRVEGSTRLSERYVKLDGQDWNPLTERDFYFGNEEALRLNPQNYQAADTLTRLRARILQAMQADTGRLCESSQVTAFEAVTVLEVVRFAKPAGEGCERAAADWLNGIWSADTAARILLLSQATRP